jgi:hypothetical protein
VKVEFSAETGAAYVSTPPLTGFPESDHLTTAGAEMYLRLMQHFFIHSINILN